jgi:Family of unknown function (DUF6152)
MGVKRSLAVVIGLAFAMVAADLAIAQHGWSGYDGEHVLNLTGAIQESGYEHPHSYVKLAAGGKVWLVLLVPPTRLERRGVSRAVPAVRTIASVLGYPHRSDDIAYRSCRPQFCGVSPRSL